jgi:branched-subunit amino acid ABC-type transport system permease component
MLVAPDLVNISDADMTGELLLLGSSLSYGIGNVYAKRNVRGLAPRIPALFQVFLAACVIVPIALIVDRPFQTVHPAPEAILAIAWLGILGSGFAYLCYFTILANWGATRTSMVAYLLPVVGIALMGAVQVFYHRTAYGKQLKAVAYDTEADGLMGIHVPRAVATSYVLSSLLAAVAGILLAPLLNVSATMGTLIGLKAFAVAIIGGLGSAGGIVLAGFAYGLVESFVAGYLSTGAREIVGFAVVIAMLIVRPWGLGGARPARRV